MHEVVLAGCTPAPLGSYLKALGVMRLVAEQADPNARGAWRNDAFVLTSALDAEALRRFFCERYSPTPVIAPWNGGSGFFPKDNRDALDAIVASEDDRFRRYKTAIGAAQAILERLSIGDKPDKEAKATLLLPALRSGLPDDALVWVDAAVVLTSDGPKYPPLLGTGGNDGRLDFTNNQMQRLVELLGPTDERSRRLRRDRLDAALFGTASPSMTNVAIGQYAPSAAGGANTGFGFDRDSVTNPWDYVLLIEGAMLFAAAASKRLDAASGSAMVAPFMVTASGVGYASAAGSDPASSRHELWLPLWERPASIRELKQLLAEGRAKVDRRNARNGVDFAVAVSSLGVDRGISAFQRFGFHRRNGLAYFAIPLGRLAVRTSPDVDLLAPLDRWLQLARRGAASEIAPASIRRAVRNLDHAIMNLASQRPSAVADVLLALGEVDTATSRSTKHDIPPVPPLAFEWAVRAEDGTPEFALAASLASNGLRQRLVRWSPTKPYAWQDRADAGVVWTASSLARNLVSLVRRREVEASQGSEEPAVRPRFGASIPAIAAYLRGEVDEGRLEAWASGLALVGEWRAPLAMGNVESASADVDFAFAIVRLAASRRPHPDVSIPRTPGLVARLASGDVTGAVALAARRLRGAGLLPRAALVHEPTSRGLLLASALAFPLDDHGLAILARQVVVPSSLEVLSTSK